jgi:hypothetical protein
MGSQAAQKSPAGNTGILRGDDRAQPGDSVNVALMRRRITDENRRLLLPTQFRKGFSSRAACRFFVRAAASGNDHPRCTLRSRDVQLSRFTACRRSTVDPKPDRRHEGEPAGGMRDHVGTCRAYGKLRDRLVGSDASRSRVSENA